MNKYNKPGHVGITTPHERRKKREKPKVAFIPMDFGKAFFYDDLHMLYPHTIQKAAIMPRDESKLNPYN